LAIGFRYALYMSSVNDARARSSPGLVYCLVDAKLWTPEQAIASGEAMGQCERMALLELLLPTLPDDLLGRALSFARNIEFYQHHVWQV
jgi:hypothetical protein